MNTAEHEPKAIVDLAPAPIFRVEIVDPRENIDPREKLRDR